MMAVLLPFKTQQPTALLGSKAGLPNPIQGFQVLQHCCRGKPMLYQAC
jgi:hypothetical protein